MREERDPTRRQAAFDVADASILLLDAGGVVLSCSGNAGRLLGYTQEGLLGRSVTSLLADEDAARLPAITERCRQDGGWSGLLSARHRDGRPVRLMVRMIPVKEPGGSARWMVLAGDMTGAPGWDMSRHLLERMASQSPMGIAVVDTDLRYVWSNPALEKFSGGPPQHRLGRRLGDIQPDLDVKAIEAQMRKVLQTGEPVIGYEHVGRLRSGPQREVAHSMSFIRLEDDHGHPVGVYYTVTDITDRYRARQRLALLDRAGEQIGRTLDVMQTGQELADSAVPELADFVAVDLLESVLKGAEPAHRPLDDPELVPLRRVGHQSVRPGVPEAVVEIGGVARYHAGSPPIECLSSGKSWREERLDPLAREWATDLPGGRAATFLDLGLHSVMIVPIRARGTTLGITTFFRRQTQDPFEADDLSLAEEFVARAAVCLDNARRYTRERDAALVLQQNLLPHGVPEQEAVDVATCYRPADELTGLAGDWFDLIPLSGARVALVVGEVVGHGIEGAAAMGRLRTAVQTLADLDLPPDEVLAHLDDLISRAAREAGSGPGAPSGGAHTVGTSCLYAVYDPVSGDCVMASAGHLAPAIVAPDGTVTFAELPLGPALGVGGLPFECAEFHLPEGSVLALHTDGLVATHGAPGTVPDPEVGKQRLRRALEAYHLPLDNLCRTIVDDLVPTQPHDDAALLMAKTRRLGADRVASWDLPADPAVVARARQMTARQLAAWGLEDLTFTMELVVSELVTNAIRHASGPLRLRLIMELALICEVSDTGSSAPHLRHPRTTDEGGRGLFLVSQLTRRWGTRYTTNGKIIWAEQPLTERMG
ncbi:SpoIIE family protein phosphatase [Streptomyces sp. PSKA54]|uniref:SpoIIE family protein phosphatase n=2 Tax=Streptomyces TaxID=1883 RepID=A0A7W2HHL3_9ACTN|nr:SpoIIE family protein phosphatase [Streptomyces himalayensis]MBA4864137.1 SpoIIE family protein phosphatase [Streptomyces himalayensis subsp. aureolus]